MLIERKLYGQIKPFLESKEALVITGMRRVGKTSLLQYIYEQIPDPNKILLDLENPLNQQYFEATNYELVKSSLEFLGVDFNRKAYIFLDEIHLIKNLPRVLKYLIDHYPVKFFLTGSASFYLKNLFTESLVGRKYLFELFPLDFEEFLRFKQSRLHLPGERSKIDRPLFDTLFPLYKEYLYFGGFPDVVLKKTLEEKKKSLGDIFTSYFQLEVLRLGDYRKNDVIRNLILLLMQRIGSKVDLTKLASELGISRITLKEYLAFLEGTYFVKLVRPFSRSRDLEIRKIPKVYLCDSGLAGHHAQLGEGNLFENNVFQNLRIRGEVNYYERKSGGEIDFILNKKIGLEVKMSPAKRDLEKLEKLGKDIGLKEVQLISWNYSADLIKSGKLNFAFNL